jgi:Cu(I)/Ag(I) efflux system membrane fusion protein
MRPQDAWKGTTLAVLLVLAAGCQREGPAAGPAGEAAPHAEMPGMEGEGTPETSGGAPAPTEVTIDPARQQLIGVTYAAVERREVEQVVRTVGTVAYDESGLSDVTLKYHGWIEELRVDETGILVEKGQVLFDLYSPELVVTQQEYLTAYAHHRRLQATGHPEATERAGKLVGAVRERLAYWDIPPEHLRELEERGTLLRVLPIHSPARGYVVEKHVVAGSHVQAGHLLYRLADLDRVWVLADVYEYELPLVSLGQQAEVTLAYLPGTSFRGRVTYIYPYLEPKERTVKVRIELPNPGHRLKAEMYAEVLLRGERREALVVPESAVLDSGARQVVFVARGEGRFEPREVELGTRFEGFYQVLSGLAEGERIVTSANFLIDSETQLAAGMRQMQH